MDKPTGINFDRVLMRLKDFIIIATALFAIIRGAYRAAQDNTQRFKALEDRVANIERLVTAQTTRRK